MIPIRTSIRRLHTPLATILLIVANAAVFLYEVRLDPAALNHLILHHGVVPLRQSWALANHPGALDAWLLPIFTSMFLHGGWLHLLGNMLFLWVFGSALEGRLGAPRFLAVYVLAAIASSQLQVAMSAGSPMPMIGASGAIAGILGAYLLRFPFSRVLVVFPIFFIPILFELPALLFLGLWFLEQLYLGAMSSLTPVAGAASSVAWWAHVGGFAVGALAVATGLARPPAPPQPPQR